MRGSSFPGRQEGLAVAIVGQAWIHLAPCWAPYPYRLFSSLIEPRHRDQGPWHHRTRRGIPLHYRASPRPFPFWHIFYRRCEPVLAPPMLLPVSKRTKAAPAHGCLVGKSVALPPATLPSLSPCLSDDPDAISHVSVVSPRHRDVMN